jgi:hypothetical protein
MPSDIVQFQWTMRASELEMLRSALMAEVAPSQPDDSPFHPGLDDLDDYAHAALEPMLRIAGTISIGYLAARMVDRLQDTENAGLILDAGRDVVAIQEHSAVERGTLLIIDRHGVQVLRSPQSDAIAVAIRARAIEENNR